MKSTKTSLTTSLIALVSALLISACSSMGSSGSSSASSRAMLVEQSHTALNALYASTPRALELRSQATAILVFPNILKAGLLVGGSGGNGVLLSPDGRTLGYYNATALSYGLQAGAQSFSEAMFMMKPSAVEYLNNSDGWSIGAGPSVVVMDTGMAKDFSSTTTRSDVYAFIFGQQGLMGGIGVQGQKITKLDP